MPLEQEIKKILDKTPFGLTEREIALRMDISEKTASRIMERMNAEKKIKKTKAGRAYFYSGLKYVLLTLFFFSFSVNAQEMSSASYNMSSVLDTAGGRIQSASFTAHGSTGQVSDQTQSISYNLCAGFLCNVLEFILNAKITFLLEFNISGNQNDTAFVDNFTAFKQYRPSDLINYYTCVQDSNISGSPTFGIIFAGSLLNYINLSSGNSFAMRVSQEIPGNKFILPITKGNCTVFNPRMAQIAQFGAVLQPFSAINEAIGVVELALQYPNIDIAGDFDRTGSFKLVIEKNDTNENQIIVRPV